MREQIIGLMTPLMAIVFMSVFAAFWQRGRLGNYVLGFAAAYLLFACGFLVTHFSDTASPFVFPITQAFYSAGSASLIWGALDRAGLRFPAKRLAMVYVLSAASLVTAINLFDDSGPWLQIVNAGYGVMFVIGAAILVRASRRDLFDRLLVLVFAISALDFLIRPTLTLQVEQSIDPAAYRETFYYAIINLVLVTKSVLTAFVLIGACASDQMRALRLRSERDPLSGLRNRAAFESDVVAMLARARAESVPVSLVVADIDHFKAVNDAYGHQAGDRGIAAFGTVVSGHSGIHDVSGRIGGEEFCVALWDCDAVRARAITEGMRQALAVLPIEAMPEDHRLSASFGVAERADEEGYGKLFARADLALYRAKGDGRNCVRCAEDSVIAAVPPARVATA